uniref:Uncharacterized protein n=1 Tax=Rhizophora mucronata TaxID=61149 RepID=A0A2P2NE07_RHIMU
MPAPTDMYAQAIFSIQYNKNSQCQAQQINYVEGLVISWAHGH